MVDENTFQLDKLLVFKNVVLKYYVLQWHTTVTDTVRLELLAEVSTDSHAIRAGSLAIFQEQDGICELLIVDKFLNMTVAAIHHPLNLLVG